MGILSRFKKELHDAQARYKSICSVLCPYFSKKITFNSDGFHHLRYKSSGSERDKNAQTRKFRLIAGVEKIIAKSGTVQQYRKQWGAFGRKRASDGSRNVKEMQYWWFEGILGNGVDMVRIKTIVRQVGAGEPHFWSVMSDTNFKRKSTYKMSSDDILDE